ncbi:MAG: iron ABC transporter permease, partial [Prevotellaceae bacterium]|nr:iron ABC transporter permease [Prevotellaceae bacterium]
MRKYILLVIAVASLFVLSLIHGSVAIPLRDIWAVFTGGK